MRIFIDMDGVMADFVGHARMRAGLPEADPYSDESFYEVVRAAGLESKERLFELLPVEFWEELPVIEKGLELYYWCRTRFETYVCSTAVDGKAMHGKYLWLRATLGLCFDRLRKLTVFTHHKHLLAQKDCVLIDDLEALVTKFTKAGGMGIHFRPEWFYDIIGALDRGREQERS